VLQGAPETALVYVRHAKEIVDVATAGQRAAIDVQMTDAKSKFLDAVNGVLNDAPGSENTAALVKSAVAAANSAYDSLSKVSKQALDTVEANVANATEAAKQTSHRSAAPINACATTRTTSFREAQWPLHSFSVSRGRATRRRSIAAAIAQLCFVRGHHAALYRWKRAGQNKYPEGSMLGALTVVAVEHFQAIGGAHAHRKRSRGL
jgi:hypothetical protein